MAASVEVKVSVAIVAAVAVAFALYQAASVFAPLAAALFAIGVVWPLQQRLQLRMPKLIALAITLIVTIAVCLAFASLAAWGFGRVGHSLVADASRYQALYENVVKWLDDRGISIMGVWAEHFNVGWVLRAAQRVAIEPVIKDKRRLSHWPPTHLEDWRAQNLTPWRLRSSKRDWS